MSHLHIRLMNQVKATKAFEKHIRELKEDLGRHAPRRWLDVRVELLEELVEKTGGSLLTEQFRLELCEVKKQVALRDNLREVRV